MGSFEKEHICKSDFKVSCSCGYSGLDFLSPIVALREWGEKPSVLLNAWRDRESGRCGLSAWRHDSLRNLDAGGCRLFRIEAADLEELVKKANGILGELKALGPDVWWKDRSYRYEEESR